MKRSKPKVAVIIGTQGLPASYGGFETFAARYCEFRDGMGQETIVVAENSKNSGKPVVRYSKGTVQVKTPFPANGFQSVLHDGWSLVWGVLYARRHPGRDVHLLLLGTSGGVFLLLLRLLGLMRHTKVHCNIAGLEWTRSKWSYFARKFLKVSEHLCVKFSDTVVGDNQELVKYMAGEYRVSAHYIAYGGDQALVRDEARADEALKAEFPAGTYDLAVARCQPDNNIEIILDAYVGLDRQVAFVSNWAASQYGDHVRAKYAGCANIHLVGPIYDLNDLNYLRWNCNVYLHGHSAGGTNPALVEAMYLGKPLICFDVSYNRSTTEGNALFFADSEELRSHLGAVDKTDFTESVANCMQLANTRYTWDAICKQYNALMKTDD